MATDLDLFGDPIPASSALNARFVVPPFSILDARQGYWQDRKRAWLALGIESELGRGGGEKLTMSETVQRLKPSADQALKRSLAKAAGGGASPGGSPRPACDYSKQQRGDGRGRAWTASKNGSGTSIFDPVLCELSYRWYCPEAGKVLDPFAGGSVRGIVASKLGRQYIGVELRPEQVNANRQQAERICGEPAPLWIVGDSRDVQTIAAGQYDFIFSCPPYGNLEVYSDDPRDLSTLGYHAFIEAYRQIIEASAAMLKPNRFACFCVGDFRDDRGFYCNFVSDTIAAFQACGLRLYNECILITAVGSLPIRIGKQFASGRKTGKTHQNVLVFFNGDPRRIRDEFPQEIETGDFNQW